MIVKREHSMFVGEQVARVSFDVHLVITDELLLDTDEESFAVHSLYDRRSLGMSFRPFLANQITSKTLCEADKLQFQQMSCCLLLVYGDQRVLCDALRNVV